MGIDDADLSQALPSGLVIHESWLTPQSNQVNADEMEGTGESLQDEDDDDDSDEDEDEEEDTIELLPEEEGRLPEAGQATCVVCQELAAVATFIHGTTGHTACCVGCARQVQQHKQGCPVCRRPFVAVIRNFNA